MSIQAECHEKIIETYRVRNFKDVLIVVGLGDCFVQWQRIQSLEWRLRTLDLNLNKHEFSLKQVYLYILITSRVIKTSG